MTVNSRTDGGISRLKRTLVCTPDVTWEEHVTQLRRPLTGVFCTHRDAPGPTVPPAPYVNIQQGRF